MEESSARISDPTPLVVFFGFAALAAGFPASAATMTFDTECGANPVELTPTSATCVYGNSIASASVDTVDMSHITVTASLFRWT